MLRQEYLVFGNLQSSPNDSESFRGKSILVRRWGVRGENRIGTNKGISVGLDRAPQAVQVEGAESMVCSAMRPRGATEKKAAEG